MKNKKTGLILVLTFVLLLVGASVLYSHLGTQVEPQRLMVSATTVPTEVPDTTDVPDATDAAPSDVPDTEYTLAPDFIVYDGEGNEVHLHDYIGKPIVLNFWASWCPPCQMEMPDFNETYLQIGEEVQFLMVNATGGRETKETADEFIASKGYSFPVLYDTTSIAAMTYGAYGLPTTFFINAEGYVIAYAEGAIDKELLQVGLDMIYFPDNAD